MFKWLSHLFSRKSSPEIIERKNSIERLILAHQRRLQKLKEHQGLPHVLMEIEDIEVKIQQLQAALENDSADREKTEATLTAHKRRLETLRKMELRNKDNGHEQEIKEIETKLQELQAELEQLVD